MEIIEIFPGIQRVPARSRIPHAKSHAYVLESSEGLLLVEPAHFGLEEASWWLEWIHTYRPAALVLTHHHLDHTIGVETLQAETGLPVWAPPRGSPTQFTPHQTYSIGRELREGDTLGGWQVIDTPGHAHEHVALRRGGVVVAGDLTKQGDGHAHQAVASIARVAALDPELVLPAHGEPITCRMFGPWMEIRRVLNAWRIGEDGIRG